MAIVVEGLVWWILMVGVWDITLSGTTLADIAAAAGAGLISAVIAVTARRATESVWRPSLRWVRWLPVFAASVVVDLCSVFGLALRHWRHRDVDGDVVDLPLERVGHDRTHRALAALTLSATPGTFVIDTDPEHHVLITHAIVSGKPDLGKAVRR